MKDKRNTLNNEQFHCIKYMEVIKAKISSVDKISAQFLKEKNGKKYGFFFWSENIK